MKLGSLNKGEKIEIRAQITPKGENVPWYKIIFNYKFAYIKSTYIEINFTNTENLQHKIKEDIGQVRKLFGFTHADPLASGYIILSHQNPDGLITLESDATMYVTPNISKEYLQIYTNGEFSASLNDPTSPVGVELLGAIKSSQFGAGLRLFGGDVYVKVMTNGVRWALKFELYKTWKSDKDNNIEITASVTFSLTFDWIPDFPSNNLPPSFAPEIASNYKTVILNLQRTLEVNKKPIILVSLAAVSLAAVILSGSGPAIIIASVVVIAPQLAKISTQSMS